jgi:flagellar motor component MotA
VFGLLHAKKEIMKPYQFIGGLIVGAFIGTTAGLFVGQKMVSPQPYTVSSNGIIKLNKRTGETWLLQSGEWKKVRDQ